MIGLMNHIRNEKIMELENEIRITIDPKKVKELKEKIDELNTLNRKADDLDRIIRRL